MGITIEDVREKLRGKDYKLTTQRQIIIQAFLEVSDKHLSAEDVYNIVKQQHSDIGLATVYRTLDLLADLEVLNRMDFGDGRSRYELNQGDSHQHHHLLCLGCRSVMEFEDDLLDALEEVIAKKSKFQIVDHQLKFYGYCCECQKQKKYG